MKLFKKIDFWIQVILIAGSLIFIAFEPSDFITTYFIVGGWQLFSCIIHVSLTGHFISHRWRTLYYRTLLGLVISTLLLYVTGLVLLLLFLMVFLPPVLACWYAFTCSEENDLLMKKAFIHLK
ncbi:hypothetical protein LZZ85_19345 [Terrimonas sp. NA20]|uniref:Uncharacterized protein n=1 Tax=Terrimonas ginsenosidimutans TaxID=2908004 RepID=A0ABS9KW55_9BACT|nr:hypothetical protein [Terrimonas ginsenosidimutans]MCG2616464.1 hypothetical protein [Terrimonas ginsenosidimutans]